MKFEISRNELLKPVQAVIGVVERRQTMAVLANVLVVVENNVLTVTATDLEVELQAQTSLACEREGRVTVPGRKLYDICRALPEEATVSVELNEQRLTLSSGRSRFSLSTLPADEFPVIEGVEAQTRFTLNVEGFKKLLDRTQFAMAQQDVRYYLNGLLLEVNEENIRAVATDGHRLALCEHNSQTGVSTREQVIIPRKGVIELQRLLASSEGEVSVALGGNKIRASVGKLQFTSKLVDGRFPDYDRVIPKNGNKIVYADRFVLRDALARTAILSGEKFKGVRLALTSGSMGIQAHNPDQEEAQDEIGVDYDGEALEIGFNVQYILDALGALEDEKVELKLSDPNSSCLILNPEDDSHLFVVMPMRL